MSKPKRKYVDSRTHEVDTRGRSYGRAIGQIGPQDCEHCDGERSTMVRFDELRGYVCQPCDSSLDEMLKEKP
jgi:hypothetical protein